MEKQSAREILLERLNNDERVQWEGKPEKIKLLEPPFHILISIRWFFGVAVIGMIFWYIDFLGDKGYPVKQGQYIILALILWSLYLFLKPFKDLKKMKKVCYMITNQRVIAYRKQDDSILMHTAELEKIKEITIVKHSGGTGTFYFTSKPGRFFNSSREDVPTYDRIEKMELPLIFTNIANPMELRNFIPDSISFICEGKKISAKNQNKSINPRLATEKK